MRVIATHEFVHVEPHGREVLVVVAHHHPAGAQELVVEVQFDKGLTTPEELGFM